MNRLTPRSLFRGLAVAEAITWALLLTGMFLKYVTETTELGVQVFGMVHGVVFIAYCLVTVLVAVDQRWSLGRTAARPGRGGPAVRDGALRRGTPSAARCSVTNGSRATTARRPGSARCAGCCGTTGSRPACSWSPSPGSPARRWSSARPPEPERQSGQSPRCSLFQVWGVATPETAMRSRDW